MRREMKNYQTTFLFNCRILLILYLVEFYNHISRALRPSYVSTFKYSWMYVSGGMIMNLIGFYKIRKKPKICEYVMYIVNGFIYIGAALVLLGFHSMAGQGQMIKSYYLAFIQELNGESYSDFLSKMQEDQEFQDLLKIMPHRHEMDVFADMITAIVIWSTILLLTAMNIVVASFEIRRIKCARSMGTATSSNEFVELLTGLIRSGSYRNEERPVDLPPSYSETCPQNVIIPADPEIVPCSTNDEVVEVNEEELPRSSSDETNQNQPIRTELESTASSEPPSNK